MDSDTQTPAAELLEHGDSLGTASSPTVTRSQRSTKLQHHAHLGATPPPA